jgi:hypothetical protein
MAMIYFKMALHKKTNSNKSTVTVFCEYYTVDLQCDDHF